MDDLECASRAVKHHKTITSVIRRILMTALAVVILVPAIGPRVMAADDAEPPREQIQYSSFENGNLSSKTGAVSNANKYPIRSKEHIAIDDFVSAKVNAGYYVRYFAYDGSYGFLGTCKGVRSFDREKILQDHPDCVYVKILINTSSGAKMDPDKLDAYGASILIHAPQEDVPEEEQIQYSSFENGNLSSKTGAVSNANKYPIRSKEHIAIDDFVSAKVNAGYYVRYFAYDGSYGFLGTCKGVRSFDREKILQDHPDCVYVKILINTSSGAKMDPDKLNAYGACVSILKRAPGEILSIEDIRPFSNGNNEYTAQNIVVYKDYSGADRSQIISCSASFSSADDSYPTIRFVLMSKDDKVLYTSPYYQIGGSGEQTDQQWRFPPFQKDYDRLKVQIVIPDNVTLYITDLSCAEETDPYTGGDDILFHAHQGFLGLCGPSTEYSFRMAGEMGYESCITIPKFTADGVCVCFHDDDSIRNRLRYLDGSKIPEGSEDDKKITEFDYDDLMRFDAGVRKSYIYKGERVPTLETFFAVCAEYDMAPVLTIHSGADFYGDKGVKHFAYIRVLAEKYGLLGRLRIKSGNLYVQTAARTVFDHDIAGYILVQAQTSSWDPLNVAKRSGFVDADAETMAESDYWVVMEYFYAAATDAKLELAKREGFPLSIATTSGGISGPELKRLIASGVTEFTIDQHCSMGLNW